MVNLLFLIANSFASDVYEICRHEKQHWNDREQKFETKYVSTFYSRQPMQLIIHERMFEINRDKRSITNKQKIEQLSKADSQHPDHLKL